MNLQSLPRSGCPMVAVGLSPRIYEIKSVASRQRLPKSCLATASVVAPRRINYGISDRGLKPTATLTASLRDAIAGLANFFPLAPAAVLVAACLAGCGTPMNSVERADPVGQRQMIDDKRLLVDAGLDLRARVVGLNQAMTPGGLLKVQAEIMNNSRYQKKFNYRWEWFDQNGMQVSTPGNDVLIPVVIEGKESKFISGLAPTPACQDFRLKLIKPY